MKAKSSQQITKLDDITVGSIYSIDVIYTSPWKVRVETARGLAQEFRIVLPAKFKIKNSTSSVHSHLQDISRAELASKECNTRVQRTADPYTTNTSFKNIFSCIHGYQLKSADFVLCFEKLISLLF